MSRGNQDEAAVIAEDSIAAPGKRQAFVTRLWRPLLMAALVLLVSFMVGVVVHAPVCWPFDFVWNLGSALPAQELCAPRDGKVRVVFLQHGMWRTKTALDRLQRTLEQAGYEVVNTNYPSTDDYLEGHAKRLRDVVEARFAKGKVDELSFVGHSMGGLVIHEYLRRPDAREPKACVYIATPQRGAVLANKRRHWFLFEIAMGNKASFQLATVDPIHQLPIRFAERSGAIVGDIGDGNADIPGHDDGTVGVEEASFAGVHDTVLVPFGHTRIVVVDEVLSHVLHFLLRGGFAVPGRPG